MSHGRLDHLNPPQREAVTTLAGPILILAGAGTGKTRVITHRMVELIRSGVAPEQILSVTFTNKAAGEMLERTRHLLGGKTKRKPFISTFHALCVRILRAEIGSLGYPANFVIYDRGDQESAVRTALRDIRLADQSIKPADALGCISKWKTAGVSPVVARENVENDKERLAAAAYRRYQQNLKACGAVDFDDLLLLTVKLFQDFPEVLVRTQERFSHVQIDEYQDTNTLQFELIEALVRPHQNLCVVGDDDQSIYGWRGAEVRHILGFQSVFPTAKVIRLEDNYRCTDKILELANNLVRHNRTRHAKTLVAHKPATDGIRYFKFPDEEKEASQIVADIDYFIREQRVPPGDVAILFRTNEQPRPFETELRRRRLPYVVLGTQSFFDRKEIRDLLAFLKVLAQPADEMSLLRIINVPPRGIGEATVERLLARAVKQKTSLWDAIPAAREAGELNRPTAEALAKFHQLLEGVRAQARAHPRDLVRIFRGFLDQIGYADEIARLYKEPQQQLARLESLEQMFETLEQYLRGAERPSLDEFLQEASLTGRDETPDKEDQLAKKGIKLMTLHSAKGLEFPHVYLVGLEEGILPHKRSADLGGTAIEEERRLAYVGITRARDCLTLSRAVARKKWGKSQPTLPSRFLREMFGETPPPSVLSPQLPPSETGVELGAEAQLAAPCPTDEGEV